MKTQADPRQWTVISTLSTIDHSWALAEESWMFFLHLDMMYHFRSSLNVVPPHPIINRGLLVTGHTSHSPVSKIPRLPNKIYPLFSHFQTLVCDHHRIVLWKQHHGDAKWEHTWCNEAGQRHDGKRQNEMTKKESSNGHRPAIDRHHKLNAQGP